jgi:hypothetical protein
MRHRIFADYSRIDLSSAIGRKKFFGAICAYVQAPGIIQQKMFRAGTTQFTTSSDFPVDIKELIDRYHMGIEEIDTGYLEFFQERNFAGTTASGFRVREVSSGLTFEKRAEGGRAKIYRVSGTEVFVSFDTYGGGLEYDQAWFDDQEWWAIEDQTVEFTSGWYRDKATVMYGLIGNLTSSNNVAWDTAGSNQLEKDINTLNTAAAGLLTAMKTAGWAVTPATPIKVLSPIELRGRLQRALAAQYITPATAGAHLKVEYNITPVYSMNVQNAGAAATDKWYMGVPGLKTKIGEKMPLTVFTEFNARAFATTAVGWGRYGAYFNEDQFRRLATA